MGTISRATRAREQWQQGVEQMRNIIMRADDAKRDLTRDELEEVQRIEVRVAAAKAEIEAAEGHIGLRPQLQVGDERSLTERSTSERPRSRRAGIFDGAEARAILESPNPSGGYMVPSGVSRQFWDALVADSIAMSGGVPVIQTDLAQVTLPAIDNTGPATWLGEAEEITPGDPQFAGFVARPIKVAGLRYVSNEILADAVPDVLALVEDDLRGALARAIDLAFFEGTGAGQPLGLSGTSGTLGTTLGSNPTVDTFKTGIDAMLNADSLPTFIGMHPQLWSYVSGLKTGVASSNEYLLQSNVAAPTDPIQRSILGVPVLLSSQLANTGNATNAYFVNAAGACFVRRQDIQIAISTDVAFTSDQTAIRAVARIDCAFPIPGAHYVLKNADPTA